MKTQLGVVSVAGMPAATIQAATATITIQDTLATVAVEQRFAVCEGFQERQAEYRFPMDPTAAVGDLVVTLGDRVMRGEVRERAAAAEMHQSALASGVASVLVEQSECSSDVLVVKLGCVGDAPHVDVQVTYVTTVASADGAMRFTLPLGIAPRYGDDAASRPAAFRMRITADVTLSSPVKELQCPSHPSAVTVEDAGECRRVVTADLLGGLARDFVLAYSAEQGSEPRVWVEAGADTVAVAAVLHPVAAQQEQPTDLMFLVDCSGSMEGAKMESVKRALRVALHSLAARRTVHVDVAKFGSRLAPWYESLNRGYCFPVAGCMDRLDAFIDDMAANMGGTDLLNALRQVVDRLARRATGSAFSPSVILLTDGEVANTNAVVAMCRQRYDRHGVRVFTVGLGEDVSHALVEGVACSTAAFAEFIQPGEESSLEGRVLAQLQRAMQPKWSNVRVALGAELAPFLAFPPCGPRYAHAGCASFVFAVLRRQAADGTALPREATLCLKATTPRADTVWYLRVCLDAAPGDARALHMAAARARVGELEAAVDAEPGLVDAGAVAEAVRLAEAHGVLSRWTSVVAVDNLNRRRAVQPKEEPQQGSAHPVAAGVAKGVNFPVSKSVNFPVSKGVNRPKSSWAVALDAARRGVADMFAAVRARWWSQPPSCPLRDMLQLQLPEGSWPMCAQLVAISGRASSPPQPPAWLQTATVAPLDAARLWATAAVVCLLRSRFSHRSSEWTAAVEKALAWARSRLLDPDSEQRLLQEAQAAFCG